MPFLVILTVLVFVHEMGHYLVARKNGVKVEVFAVGFGGELFGWTDRLGTRWKVCAIPLGGYVKMFGDGDISSSSSLENSNDDFEERESAFHHKSLGARAAIVLAGPVANFLFAIILLAGLYSIVGQRYAPPIIDKITSGSSADIAGLVIGDEILQVNDQNIKRDLPTNTYKNWKANVLTIYPEMFPGSLNFGVIGNALKQGVWSLEITDIKKFAIGKHKNVDERPIGGGPGMILRSDVIDNTLNSIRENESKNHPLIYLTPKGNRLSQELVERFSKTDGVTILCGRFGGIDERVITHYNPIEISVGDFILSGAEIAAQALIDSTVRSVSYTHLTLPTILLV